MPSIRTLAVAFSLLVCHVASADEVEITLKNGDIVEATLVSMDANAFVLRDANGQVFQVQRSEVRSWRSFESDADDAPAPPPVGPPPPPDDSFTGPASSSTSSPTPSSPPSNIRGGNLALEKRDLLFSIGTGAAFGVRGQFGIDFSGDQAMAGLIPLNYAGFEELILAGTGAPGGFAFDAAVLEMRFPVDWDTSIDVLLDVLDLIGLPIYGPPGRPRPWVLGGAAMFRFSFPEKGHSWMVSGGSQLRFEGFAGGGGRFIWGPIGRAGIDIHVPGNIDVGIYLRAELTNAIGWPITLGFGGAAMLESTVMFGIPKKSRG